jgi:hypothetical protein
MVMNPDDHQAHVPKHKRLLATPWLRNVDIAEKLNMANAPAIQKTIQVHIVQNRQVISQGAAVQEAPRIRHNRRLLIMAVIAINGKESSDHAPSPAIVPV